MQEIMGGNSNPIIFSNCKDENWCVKDLRLADIDRIFVMDENTLDKRQRGVSYYLYSKYYENMCAKIANFSFYRFIIGEDTKENNIVKNAKLFKLMMELANPEVRNDEGIILNTYNSVSNITF